MRRSHLMGLWQGQRDFLSHVSRHLNKEDASLQWSAILFGLAAFLAAALAITWWARRRPRDHDAKALFRELCAAHRLDWKSRRLLFLLTRAREIEPPARIFLEPEHFASGALGRLGKRRAAACRALQQRLFGMREPAG